jgi:flagellar basal-body rod protein FlgG
MQALDTKLDVLANNLANINTAGFKRSRTNFEDLLYQIRREPGVLNQDDEPTPHGIQVGSGVAVSGTQLDFQQGSLEVSNVPLDMAIEGEGFFQVATIWNGFEVTAYTRAGNFTRNDDGLVVLANSEGSPLFPPITIPPNVTGISVSPNGQILVTLPGDPAQVPVGQVILSRFVNPQGLEQIGKNLFLETDASGDPIVAPPQTDGMGDIRGGFLESSNVEPVTELIELIRTQRAFELNSQSIQSADEILQVVSNLRRF